MPDSIPSLSGRSSEERSSSQTRRRTTPARAGGICGRFSLRLADIGVLSLDDRSPFSPVLVATVADQAEQIPRFCKHRLDAGIILGVEREGEDARVVGAVIAQTQTAPEDRACHRGAVEDPAYRHRRNAYGVPPRPV